MKTVVANFVVLLGFNSQIVLSQSLDNSINEALSWVAETSLERSAEITKTGTTSFSVDFAESIDGSFAEFEGCRLL